MNKQQNFLLLLLATVGVSADSLYSLCKAKLPGPISSTTVFSGPLPSPPPNGTDISNSTAGQNQNDTSDSNTGNNAILQPLQASDKLVYNLSYCQSYTISQGKKASFQIGQRVSLYVKAEYANEDQSTQTLLTQFFPAVDDYSAIIVNNVSDLLSVHNPAVTVSVAFKSQTGNNSIILSTPTALNFYADTNFVVPYRTVIITMDTGVIQNIDWDPMWCNVAYLKKVNGSCAYDCNKKDKLVQDQMDCSQIRIYVVWVGSDAAGNTLQSSAQSIWRLQSLP